MNPYMLHEVRKDDVAARYNEAVRFRLAATMTNGGEHGDAEASERAVPTGFRRWASHRATRWAAAITVCVAIAAALFTMAA